MWVTCFYGACVATVEMAMDQRVQDMFFSFPETSPWLSNRPLSDYDARFSRGRTDQL